MVAKVAEVPTFTDTPTVRTLPDMLAAARLAVETLDGSERVRQERERIARRAEWAKLRADLADDIGELALNLADEPPSWFDPKSNGWTKVAVHPFGSRTRLVIECGPINGRWTCRRSDGLLSIGDHIAGPNGAWIVLDAWHGMVSEELQLPCCLLAMLQMEQQHLRRLQMRHPDSRDD